MLLLFCHDRALSGKDEGWLYYHAVIFPSRLSLSDFPMRLNPGQQQAVEFVTGPCLVLAGAGSGKTRVITNKIAHLIRGLRLSGATYRGGDLTNKAAREMKSVSGRRWGAKRRVG